jgi:hypothetical protein
MRFVVRPIDESGRAALDPGAWALTLGDLEVF